MPQIVWRGSPNFDQGRGGLRPVAIVDHIMQSSMGSARGWFANPASKVSAHYGVGIHGEIEQYVPDENVAWANGIWQNPDLSVPWLAAAYKGGADDAINPNRLTISIEHEGYSGIGFTEPQYQATLWLHRTLLDRWHIPADRAHIIGHYQITGIDRINCPGKAFPSQRLLADLQAAPPPPPPAADSDTNPDARFFSDTGFWLVNVLPDGSRCGFLDFWTKNNGIQMLGLPISGAYFDASKGPVDSGAGAPKGRVVQWFERDWIEWWPENQPPYDVQAGLAGTQLYQP